MGQYHQGQLILQQYFTKQKYIPHLPFCRPTKKNQEILAKEQKHTFR